MYSLERIKMLPSQISFKTLLPDHTGELRSVELILRQTHPLFNSIEESLNTKCLSSSSYHPEGASILIKEHHPVDQQQ